VPNQILEGKVTNVTAFGAFVDIGVHQDGLVHISALSETFVKDPRDVVKAGDIVKVKVMAIDIARARIGLSMRMSDDAEDAQERGSRRPSPASAGRPQGAHRTNPGNGKKPQSKQHRPAQQPDMASALALSLKAALEGK
jgi:uncharacterized protein